MTDWSLLVEYNCRHRHCHEPCINHVAEPWTHTKQCRSCYHDPDREPKTAQSHHLPEWARKKEPSELTTASEGEGEPGRPDAQRSEHPGPDRERPERSAPARPVGSAPSRGDPEARAHVSNPEGERPLNGGAHRSDNADSAGSDTADSTSEYRGLPTDPPTHRVVRVAENRPPRGGRFDALEDTHDDQGGW